MILNSTDIVFFFLETSTRSWWPSMCQVPSPIPSTTKKKKRQISTGSVLKSVEFLEVWGRAAEECRALSLRNKRVDFHQRGSRLRWLGENKHFPLQGGLKSLPCPGPLLPWPWGPWCTSAEAEIKGCRWLVTQTKIAPWLNYLFMRTARPCLARLSVQAGSWLVPWLLFSGQVYVT